MVAPEVQGIDLFKIAGRSISGWVPSLKTGTVIRQPFCSQLEERLMLWLEYHPLVKSYAHGDIGPEFATKYRLPIPQHAPFSIDYTFENTPHHYLLDFVGILADGTPFLAEAGMEDDKRKDRNLAKAKEVTDQGKLQYGHPLGLCLVAAGRGDTIPLKETFDLPDPTWLQFRRRFDKLSPFCRIASHTSDEVRAILSSLEPVYQPLFPQRNMYQWTSSIYGWLTNPVLDPTHSGRVTMDNLMKLVTTALERSYLAGETEVKAERFKSAAQLLVLRHDTLKLIDGAGPEALQGDQNQA